MAEKRRNPNYTKDEKILLLTIVAKYKNVVENKKTDHVTWREKDETWDKIFKEFNSASPAGVLRSVETLRKLYDNIKKNTRKIAAQEKFSSRKTGGGTDNIVTDSTYDLALSIVNTKSVFGLNNAFDCDSENVDINLDNDTEKIITCNDDFNNNVDESLFVNWGSYKPIDLQSPICEKLQTKTSKPSTSTCAQVDETNEEESQSLLDKTTKPWLKRRRPISESIKKDDLSGTYKEVGEVKLKYYKYQLEDLIKRRERENEEHEWKKEEYSLKKKSLLLDIKIKEEELKTVITKDF